MNIRLLALGIIFVPCIGFAETRPIVCQYSKNGLIKTKSCRDFSRASSADNICFFQNGAWRYGSYQKATSKFTVSLTCNEGIKAQRLPADIEAKGPSVASLKAANGVYTSTFSLKTAMSDVYPTLSAAPDGNYGTRLNIASMILAGLSDLTISTSKIPYSQVATAEKTKFSLCVIKDSGGVTKAAKECTPPKVKIPKTGSVTASYPIGHCEPRTYASGTYRGVWWSQKTGMDHTGANTWRVCSGGIEIKKEDADVASYSE